MLRTAAIALAATVALSAPALAGGKVCHGCYKDSKSVTESHVTKVKKHIVNVHVKHVKVVKRHHHYVVKYKDVHYPVKKVVKVKGHKPKGCWW